MRISDWSSDVCSSDLWLWAEGVIVEVLLIAMGSALLRRIDGPRLLLLSGVAGVVRWLALGLSTAFPVLAAAQLQIGRASCRERVSPYVLISGVAGPLKKK